VGGHCRIRQRAQKIENRANSDVAARLHGVFHSLMKQRREEKADSDARDALLDRFPRRIDLYSQSTQHVSAARLARYRTVAMFGNTNSRSGHHER
jgi:hypothetical protein